VAGVAVARLILDEMQLDATWSAGLADGDPVAAGGVIGRMEGSARDLLTGERIVLNFLGRLSGIATLTRRYVEAIAGAQAKLYDTRKTTPGWRCNWRRAAGSISLRSARSLKPASTASASAPSPIRPSPSISASTGNKPPRRVVGPAFRAPDGGRIVTYA
jgi:hypothetical protein